MVSKKTKNKGKIDSCGRERVSCCICGGWYHRLETHIDKKHNMTCNEYVNKFPGFELSSEYAKKCDSGYYCIDNEKKHMSSNTNKDNICDEKEPFQIGVAKLYQVDDSELTISQRAEVPPHDINWIPGEREMAHLESIAAGIEDGDNIFIYGPTGGGKTTIVSQLAAITNTPCIRFQFSNKITVEDFVGEKEIVIDEVTGKQITRWRDGAFTRAWREGYYILFDEFTAAPSTITLRLQGPLEGAPLVLFENGGEVIPKHSRTRIFATDNTNGRGDDTGLYAGTNVVNEATLDRFGTVIKYDYPDKETEIDILQKKTGIDEAQAKLMVEVANRIRESFLKEECYCTFGTRRLIMWAKKTVRFKDVRKACSITVLSKLGEDDAKFVDSIVQREFGGEI